MAGARGARGGRDVVVCFFGITRALEHTYPSISRNVLAPARSAAEALGGRLVVAAHLFEQERIENPRSGESAAAPRGEHRLLAADRLVLERAGGCLAARGHAALAAFGDFWEDGGASLRNLVHQLHSLDRVTDLAFEGGEEPALVIFARPDLEYHDSLAPALEAAVRRARAGRPGAPRAWLPAWQAWHGRNDRFAICEPAAARAYGRRIARAGAFCASHGPLHAERLLGAALREDGVRVARLGARASRMRVGGVRQAENFAPIWQRRLRWHASNIAASLRLKGLARLALGRLSLGRSVVAEG